MRGDQRRREPDRRQRGTELVRELDIRHADDREVVRHAPAQVGRRLQRADRHQVVGREQCSEIRMRVQQCHSGVVAALDRIVRRHRRDRTFGMAARRERIDEAAQPHRPPRSRPLRRAAYATPARAPICTAR